MTAIFESELFAQPHILDPRRIVRWIFTARLCVAAAIFIAAILSWERASSTYTLVAALAFALTMIFTAGSWLWTDLYRQPIERGFFYSQAIFDLLLVTAVVHVTGGGASQFTALYILVIAGGALLFPLRGGLLVAALCIVVYIADVLWWHNTELDLALILQLLVFAVVALGSGYIGARLHETGVVKEVLAKELVKARLQAADILRNIRSGILTIDAEGRLLYANPAAGTLLGVIVDDWIGRPFLPELHRSAGELATILENTLTRGRRTSRAEGIVETPDRSFSIGVTTTYSEGDGSRTGKTATAIFQDISDHKRLEALHLRAERLEAVAELSASLAHEIKNPLASIRSSVEQLADRQHATDDERTLSTLIVRESDRLSRLLSDFIDFARVGVTRIDKVNLAAISQHVAGVALAHPDRRPDVTVRVVASDPVEVQGDEDLLHRALFNLVLNAVQAANEGGKVEIDVATLGPDQIPAGHAFEAGGVIVRVTDDGPGIAPGVRARLFDPFITTKPGGSGLGLAVVHRAIEAHRGLVFVDSAPGQTRFTILLPVAPSGEDS